MKISRRAQSAAHTFFGNRRIDRLTRALIGARADLTEESARTLARAIVDAPSRTSISERLQSFWNVSDTHSVPGPAATVPSAGALLSSRAGYDERTGPADPLPPGAQSVVAPQCLPAEPVTVDANGYEMTWTPPARPIDANPGDLVVHEDGIHAGVVVNDQVVYGDGSTVTLQSLLFKGASIVQLDATSVDLLASLPAEHARTSVLAQLLPLFGWEPETVEALYFAAVLAPTFRQRRGIETVGDLLAWLEIQGGSHATTLADNLRFWVDPRILDTQQSLNVRDDKDANTTVLTECTMLIGEGARIRRGGRDIDVALAEPGDGVVRADGSTGTFTGDGFARIAAQTFLSEALYPQMAMFGQGPDPRHHLPRMVPFDPRGAVYYRQPGDDGDDSSKTRRVTAAEARCNDIVVTAEGHSGLYFAPGMMMEIPDKWDIGAKMAAQADQGPDPSDDSTPGAEV